MKKVYYALLLSILLCIYPACHIVQGGDFSMLQGNDEDDDDDDDDEDDDDDGDEDDDDDGNDDDGDEDDDDDDGVSENGVSDNEAEDEEEDDFDPGKKDPAPYETLDVRGYNFGYEEGRADGSHDGAISENSLEQRAYQVNDPESLYSRVTDPESTNEYNKRIGYPKTLLPVSENGLKAYKSYAAMWQEGYRDGYSYSVGEEAEELWYERGHSFGYLDAVNDTYGIGEEHGEEDRIVKNGYYEPDYEDSLYRTLSGKYGDAYRAGYDAGWKDGISSFSSAVDYYGADFDPWRINTCPDKWDTAEAYYVQTDANTDNVYFDTAENAYMTYEGKKARGIKAACSPFEWFFSEDYSYILNGRVIDKRDEAIRAHVNTAISSGSSWLYRAVDAGDGLYILIRYRVGDMSSHRNFKVKRFLYSRENGKNGAILRSAVTDHINDYYCGDEPVASYDSRKIVDMERKEVDGEEVASKNTGSKRREICADAVLVHWEQGKDAEYLGKLKVRAVAENNVNASVSGNYLSYLGDPYINGMEISPTERFYHVYREEELDDKGELKEGMVSVTFAGTESRPRLTHEDNKNINLEGPYFTLKLKGTDKGLSRYKKAVNAALKNEEFRFEIARFRIAGIRDEGEDEDAEFVEYERTFSYHSDIGEKVEEIRPVAPRRRDFENYEDYEKAVEEYEKGMEELNAFFASDEYKTGFLKELKEAREAYMNEYRSFIGLYGDKMEEYAKNLEKTVLPEYKEYDYKKKYSEDFFKDGNKDGTVSRIEQWEYDHLYGPDMMNAPYHYNFNGSFDAGENIIPDFEAYRALYEELPEYDSVQWLKGTEYRATTTIYLDPESAGMLSGASSGYSLSDMVIPELNEDFYTMNLDAKLSLGKIKTIKEKDRSRLRINPSFIYFMGDDGSGEGRRRKRRLKIRGDNKDLKLTDLMVSDKAVLLLHGENNLEGDIALRLRSSGEPGYGIWIDEETNYIDSVF